MSRVPPHNVEAERALLGAMLINRNAIDAAIGVLAPEAFYKPSHAAIYAAIVAITNQGHPADAVTVADHLQRAGLDEIGGAATLTDIIAQAGTTTNAATYVDLLIDHWQLRRLISVGNEVVELGYAPADDVAHTVDQAEQLIYGMTDSHRPTDAEPIADSLPRWLHNMEQLAAGNGPAAGIPTGFHELDELLGGLRGGQLVIVAGRPGMGKTSLGLDFTSNIASTHHPVLVISLEMSTDELESRLIAAQAGVSLQALRVGKLSPAAQDKVTHMAGQIASWPIDIYDNARASLTAIRSQARRSVRRYGHLSAIVVDYIQLGEAVGRHQNREGEVAEIARGLKKLAREMDVPVIALAQLSRSVEGRADKRPMLSDLRESGEIENAADTILFLYRDDYYNPTSQDRGTAEIIVAKQRNGPTGMARVAWLGKFTRFANMARV